MSRVTVMVVDKDGELVDIGEVRNSHLFHVAVWEAMLDKHHLKAPSEHAMTRGVAERLWRRVGSLPRPDALFVLATFDRCWFPATMLGELTTALACAPSSTNCAEVAKLLDDALNSRDRGVTFTGSLASPWSCSKTDDRHRIDDAGHACRDCGIKIQRADHVLERLKCCDEPEDAIYDREAAR